MCMWNMERKIELNQCINNDDDDGDIEKKSWFSCIKKMMIKSNEFDDNDNSETEKKNFPIDFIWLIDCNCEW